MNWELYAWLKRGNRRKEVLKLIFDSSNPLTTNEVRLKLKLAMSQASYTLKELEQKELIECLNPKDKIGRLFKIVRNGKELMENFIK